MLGFLHSFRSASYRDWLVRKLTDEDFIADVYARFQLRILVQANAELGERDVDEPYRMTTYALVRLACAAVADEINEATNQGGT